ncbi:hypothetical protein [Methylobacterium sp. CM6257]
MIEGAGLEPAALGPDEDNEMAGDVVNLQGAQAMARLAQQQRRIALIGVARGERGSCNVNRHRTTCHSDTD